MRKSILSIPVSLVLAAVSFSSMAANENAFFVNASVGSTHANVSGLTKKNSNGYGFNTGYRWGSWGVEAGYVDLGRFEANGYMIDRTPTDLRLEVAGWTLGGNGKFSFANDKWYTSARMGMFFSTTKLSIAGENPGGIRRISDSDSNVYVGAGVGYNITEDLGLSVNFDRYLSKAERIHSGTNNPYLISGTLEYRFGK